MLWREIERGLEEGFEALAWLVEGWVFAAENLDVFVGTIKNPFGIPVGREGKGGARFGGAKVFNKDRIRFAVAADIEHALELIWVVLGAFKASVGDDVFVVSNFAHVVGDFKGLVFWQAVIFD